MLALLVSLACFAPKPLPDLGALPDFTLTDQKGAPVDKSWFKEHVSVVDFIFTSCPDICPTLTTRMAEVQKTFAAEPRVQFLSISVDPATDTPPVLLTYSERFGAKYDRWRFVTGDAGAVKTVVVDGFKMIMQPEDTPGRILHGSRFVVVDSGGVIRGFPDPVIPNEVEATVRQALAMK
jgi:protein SCO1